jgi:hypothetical protein
VIVRPSYPLMFPVISGASSSGLEGVNSDRGLAGATQTNTVRSTIVGRCGQARRLPQQSAKHQVTSEVER